MLKTLFVSLLFLVQTFVISDLKKPATTHVEEWRFTVESKGNIDFEIKTRMGPADKNSIVQIKNFNPLGLLNGENSTEVGGTIKFPVDITKLIQKSLEGLNSYQKNFLIACGICGAVWGISYYYSKKINQDKEFYRDTINQVKDTARQLTKLFFVVFCGTYIVRKTFANFIN